MLTIRLQRVGKKNQPSFRVVVTDKRNGPQSGKSKETIGWYNPREHTHAIEKERVSYWLGKGAQASGTVHNLLVKNGIIKGKKIDVAPRVKLAEKKEGEGAPAPVAEEKKEAQWEVDKESITK